MIRVYKQIHKEEFLDKVKDLMESDSFPFVLPPAIARDLSKVNFDWENYTSFDDTRGFGNGYADANGVISTYPVGYKSLPQSFHIFYVNAGGDWEDPICFIFYWGGRQLRAYIPERGNVWNKKEKCAYGSENDYNNQTKDEDKDRFSLEEMEKDIQERIILDSKNGKYKNVSRKKNNESSS